VSEQILNGTLAQLGYACYARHFKHSNSGYIMSEIVYSLLESV